MMQWYSKTWNEVVETLNSNVYRGLNEAKVQQFQQKYGKNKIEIPKSNNFLVDFLEQFKKFWVILLLIATIIFIYFGHVYTGSILSVVLLINVVMMAYWKFKEDQNLLELQKLNSDCTTVIRNRKYLKIEWNELVVGDIVVLNEGDLVPADIRIIESNSLKVKEGAITGEGYTVEKYHMKIEEKEIGLSEMRNILFRSSIIIEGDAKGIVIATGMNTQIANSINMIFEEKNEKYIFRHRINKVINVFTSMISLFIILNMIINIFSKNSVQDILYNLAVNIIAVIPINIIIIIGIISYVLLNHLKKDGMEIKNLSVIENLSQISLICEDKIGVFSESDMEVEKIYVNESIINCGSDYIEEDKENADTIKRLVDIGLLCNDTKTKDGEFHNFKNDLIEIAITKFGFDYGMNKGNVEQEKERVLQIPFDTDRRIMTTINKIEDKYRANIKGAVDVLLTRCTHIMRNGVEKEITDEDIQKIKNADIDISKQGLYTMAFAYRSFGYEPSLEENVESNLVFVGLIGINNYPKPFIQDLIKQSKNMNIKPVIITEDNKITAQAFGKSIGIINRIGKVLSGVEIDNMPKDEFPRIIEKVNIFSRISSKHKLKVAKLYKKDQHTILMAGSRINDLPYLKVANVGISTGNSNIVKKLADINTEDRDFGKMLNLIKLSRRFIERIKKLMLYIFMSLVCQGGFITISYMFNDKKYMSPLNILWTNIITIMLSSLAIIFDYTGEDIDYKPELMSKDFIKENISNVLVNAITINILPILILLFNNSQTVQANMDISYLFLNIMLILYSLKCCEGYIFKNKVSNFILLINILLQMILFISSNSKLFNICTVNIMPMVLFAVWIIILILQKTIIIHENQPIEY